MSKADYQNKVQAFSFTSFAHQWIYKTFLLDEVLLWIMDSYFGQKY